MRRRATSRSVASRLRITDCPSLNLSASSWAWSKRRGRTVAGSELGGGAGAREGAGGRGAARPCNAGSSALDACAAARRAGDSKSRDGKLGRAGTALTTVSSDSVGHVRALVDRLLRPPSLEERDDRVGGSGST